MKTKWLIIEDNYYRFFTTKQVLETRFRLPLKLEGASTRQALNDRASQFKQGHIIVSQSGGIPELIALFEKRRINRLNSEIVLLATPELPQLQTLLHQQRDPDSCQSDRLPEPDTRAA